MLVAAYAQDGLTIAKLEKELAQAKSAIKRLLVLSSNLLCCDFCECDPGFCNCCESDAFWNGKGDDEVPEQKNDG